MNSMEESEENKRYLEWLELILAAKEVGLTPDEVRDFLRGKSRVTN